MNFSKHIFSALNYATRGSARWRHWLAVCVLLGAAAAGLTHFQPRAAQAQEPPATLHGAAALDRLKQDGQFDSLQAAMNEARFSVSRTEHSPLGRAAWHAPNPSAGYDAYVTEAGVSITVNDQSFVSLHLHGIGYGAALHGVAPGQVSGDKQSITIKRDNVHEWFVNGAGGLEHGFTLNEPPSGLRQKGLPLRLALQVSEDWQAVAGEDGKFVTLRAANEQAVEYGKLTARDARGLNLPAKLTVADGQVVIEVEDGDAAYPLTIDPLFSLQQRLTAADAGAGDFLGYAVALDGNTALVGAPYEEGAQTDQGAAYVFVRNGAVWTQQAKLFANDGASNDFFGSAVALDGDTALVGAPGDDTGRGSTYVFVRTGTSQPVWTQQTKLSASGSAAGAQFGAALALDGNTALIGALQQMSASSSALTGAAYVFVRSGTTQAVWTQQARLNATDGADEDRFGFSVELEGDTALIGAPGDNVGTNTRQGSAYLFTRNGASWAQQQRLTHSPAAAGDSFGNAVALSGGTALIGAYLQGSDDRGMVYDFRRGATGWTQLGRFTAPNPTAGAHFGVAVALSGDTAVIGESLGLVPQGVDKRSAYVFVNRGDWRPVRQLGLELGAANDGFGYAVALDGDTVLIGAYRSRISATAQGAAYAFVLHDSRHVEQQKLTASDGAAEDSFGRAVALSGDTLVVGASQDTIGANHFQGSAYVFNRSSGVWTQQQRLTANDGAGGDRFGGAVALSGDTLVVGAFNDDIGANLAQGSAYVFTRSGTVWTQQQKLTANDGAANDNFGVSVALSGDTVVVGAWRAAGRRLQGGSAYVFTRNGASWTQQVRLIAADRAANEFFGYSVALSGDTLAVGAYAGDIGLNTDQGAAYIFTGSGAVWTQQQKLTANDGAAGDNFGVSVALSGDTLVVGAAGDDKGTNVNINQGSAYVFTRSGIVWTQQEKLIANDGAAGDNFGISVALSGDTVVVGADSDTIGANAFQGSAYVFTNSGSWYQQQKLTAADGAAFDSFGRSVALSGDTVVVGASADDIGTNGDQGSAYVFVSPPCPAITIAPASLPNGALGAAYNQPLSTSGEAAAYQYSVSRGVLPPGLTLNPLGLLLGTPTAAGTYRFTITATHVLSLCPGSRAYTITVTSPCPTITISPATLPNGAVGATYNQTVTATGGLGQHSFAVTAGALPPGLSMNVFGSLRGAPTQAGSYNFTVTATSNGCTGTRAYTLTIGSPGCDYSVTPKNHAFPSEGGNGVVSVNAGDSCAWTAVSNDPMITITSGANGSGAGTVRFAVAKNPNAGARRGALTIAGRKVTVVQAPPLACVSAASFAGNTLASESIVAAFGNGLAKSTEVATAQPLPATLAGTKISVIDSLGTERFAPLFFVSPTQINFQVPPGTAAGKALVTVIHDDEMVAAGNPQIEMVSPGLFSANASGQGLMIGVALRVRADGSQSFEPVVRFDDEKQQFVAAPINLGPATDRIFLILFATGVRHRSSLGTVSVKIGGVNADVLYAGPQGSFVGLDQLNVSLPRSLAGRGELEVNVLVDGQEANKLTVAIK